MIPRLFSLILSGVTYIFDTPRTGEYPPRNSPSGAKILGDFTCACQKYMLRNFFA